MYSENATNWMIKVASDSSHGYDQRYRWGEKGDYDCSSAVITAWQQAGVPVKTYGATYTGNMYSVFLKCGFKDVTSQINLTTGNGLKRGDVLLNKTHHTAMWTGTQIVQASINERGGTIGGIPGDQTGKEFYLRSYYNYPWDCVLRYAEKETIKKQSTTIPYGISKKISCSGVVTADVLNVRTWAGTHFSNIKSYPILKCGDTVDICSKIYDTKKKYWYYVKIANKYYGFVHSDYIEVK